MLLSVNVSVFVTKQTDVSLAVHSLHELHLPKNLAVNNMSKISILTMYLNQRIKIFLNFNHTFKIEEMK